ncbi:MAG: 7-cyano-7-deazaguanine synthase QueC [Deltaproteobacteria bacterium]|nr:7-cyano-7-deazaguanine synthase QueC [Deltaproteobacteria bacterium]
MRTKQEKKAVVLLSGGLDSATVAAIAGEQGFALYCLSFRYGQRHAVEIDRACRLASFFEVSQHLILNLDLGLIGGSALTDRTIAVPKEGEGLGLEKIIPVTYVPARNTIFLAYAASWAEVVGARDIFLGVNALDYSGYPDCRPEYLAAMERAVNLGTRQGIEHPGYFRLQAPLLALQKSEIIQRGTALGVDYGLTVSCYDPDPQGRPCRRCDSCRLREKGFRAAGLVDPVLQEPG